MTNFLNVFPWWAYLFCFVVLGNIFLYFVTRQMKRTLKIFLISLAVAIFITLLHSFRLYLENHFLGFYDEAGLPSLYEQSSGWHLFFSAWVIWVFPVFIISSVLIFLSLSLQSRFLMDKFKAKKQVPVSDPFEVIQGKRISDIQKNFEVDKLHRQIAGLKEQIYKMQEIDKESRSEEGSLAKQNEHLRKEVAKYLHEIDNLKVQQKETEEKLVETSLLLKKFLEESSDDQ